MTAGKKPSDPLEELNTLLDADLQAILDTGDDEIIAEAMEVSPSLVDDTRQVIADAVTTAGKRCLAAARAELDAEQQVSGQVLSWPLERKVVLLRQVRESRANLTIAARQMETETENDLDSDLDALVDLGVIDEEGNLL